MKKNQEQPPGTTALLAKRVQGSVRSQNYVDWAVQALAEGFDSPSLSILAGLDIEKDFSRLEAENCFAKVVQELGLVIPMRKSYFAIISSTSPRRSKRGPSIPGLRSTAFIAR